MARRLLVLVTATSVLLGAGAEKASTASGPAGSGSPACLRGHWLASQAETSRVMHALVPVEGLEPRGRLYMLFRDGAFQYGSTHLVLQNTVGPMRMTASARFFSLAPYTARRGLMTLGRGETTIEYGPMSATKGGRTYTVPGPAPRTQRIPGGSVPFQCRGATLKVRLPRFAALDWITLHRA
jgi:hypothetical protein